MDEVEPIYPEVYDYTDGFVWLNAWFDWWREQRRRNTQLQFAEQAGVTRSNVTNVLQRARVPSQETLGKYNTVIHLDPERFAYLCLLFEKERVIDHQLRTELVGEIQRRQRDNVDRTRPAVDRALLDSWENVVLREAARGHGIPPDPAEVAALFRTPVEVEAVAAALDWLRERGMLVAGPGGRLVADRAAIRAGAAAPGVRGTHRRALAVAERAIETVPLAERELRILMAGLRAADVPLVIAEARTFISRVADIADHSGPPDVVYQISLQLVPVLTPPPPPEGSREP